MTTREAEVADAERVREVASSAMSSAYAISPGQIEVIVDEQFGDEATRRKVEGDEAVMLVTTADEDEADDAGDVTQGTVVGVAEATVDGDRGEIRWLFVDPEFWDLGHGTALFERLTEEVERLGVTELRGATIARNEQGQDFCEQFGFERVNEREAEIGGETFVEHVYAQRGHTEGERDPETAEPEEAPPAREGVETDEGEDTGVTKPEIEVPETLTTEDGTRVYVDRDEPLSGIQAPFFQTFEDEAGEDPYGYFCGKCGSTEIEMDSMGLLECERCGNQHRSRDGYDASYL